MVINDDLMGNHQLELAHQLSNDGHLYYCNCRFVTFFYCNLQVDINDDLMGNHQLELAYQLSYDGHLYYCNCRFVTLHSTLIY